MRDVAMPDKIGAFGLQQAIGLDANGLFHWRSGFSRRLFRLRFPQHTLHGRTADLDARPQQMPGHGAGSEFRLRADSAQFICRPAHGVIHTVPNNRAAQQTASSFSLHGIDPSTDGIGMDRKVGSGLLNTPTGQAHQLDDLQPLRSREMGAPVRRVVGPIGTENVRPALLDAGSCRLIIALDGQPLDRRAGGTDPYAGQLIGLTQHNGHGVDSSQCCDRIERHTIPSRTKCEHDTADGATVPFAEGGELSRCAGTPPAAEASFLASTDANGNVTSYVYNAANEQTSTVTNNLSPVTSSYDADGNLVSTINAGVYPGAPGALQTNYTYDNLDRQTVEKQYGLGGNLNDTITSTYDPAGRLTSVSDSASTTTYTYDSLNRVTAETTTYAYMTGSVTINHQYDAAGNTTLTYLTINNGTTSVYDMFTAYTYNAQNMVTMMQRFDLSDGLAAGLISGSQFSSSSSSNTVTALDGITGGTVSAGGYVNAAANNQFSADITAGDGASLISSGTFTGSASAGSGSLSLIAGGAVIVNNVTAAQNLTIAALGSVATASGGLISGQTVQIAAGGNLAADISGTYVTVTTLGDDNSTVLAVESLQVQAQGSLNGYYTSDGTLELASWTGISSSTTATAEDISNVWSIGPIAGSFTGTENIGSIQSYSDINAAINSGNNQTGLPSNEGNIQSVQAWGAIGGTITASNNIDQVISASDITAYIYVGDQGEIASIIAHDQAITEATMPVSPLNMAAFQAAMNQFANAMTEAAQQAGTEAGTIAQALASVQALVNQEAAQAQAANCTELADAQSQIAGTSAAATAQIAIVGQEIAQAQADAAQQINQAVANAQTQDQQLNQQALDQLNGAAAQAQDNSANLQAASAYLLSEISQTQSQTQQIMAVVSKQVQQASSQWQNNWAEDVWGAANEYLVQPLEQLASNPAQFLTDLQSLAGEVESQVLNVGDEIWNSVSGAYEGAVNSAAQIEAGVLEHGGKMCEAAITGASYITLNEIGALGIAEAIAGNDFNGQSLSPVQRIENGVTGALNVAALLLVDAPETVCGLIGPGCFIAGTQVVTGVNSSGGYTTEAIQNITVGQQVLTRNQNDPTGPLQEETVTAVQVHTVYSLRDVTIENANPDNTSQPSAIGTGSTTETIDTTDSHPFYVQGQGWVSADDLIAGEILSTPDGQTETVVGTSSVAETQGVQVYNFTVADDHTYFVKGFGSGSTSGTGTGSLLDAVWVHNNCNLPSNSVYWSLGKDGQALYVGITNDIQRRAAEHLLETGMKIRQIDGLTGLTRYDARAVEQALIEKFGFASDGGKLRNLINSISRLNPNYQDAISRGMQLLESVGF